MANLQLVNHAELSALLLWAGLWYAQKSCLVLQLSFHGQSGPYTESAGGEMETWVEPSRKVLEGSHELNDNIVIPVSVLLQNICIGFRDSDNWTDNVWSQPPWTSLVLQLMSSVYCSILGKTSQQRKMKLTWGSSSLFIKEYTLYLPLLRHFILYYWSKWEENIKKQSRLLQGTVWWQDLSLWERICFSQNPQLPVCRIY